MSFLQNILSMDSWETLDMFLKIVQETWRNLKKALFLIPNKFYMYFCTFDVDVLIYMLA